MCAKCGSTNLEYIHGDESFFTEMEIDTHWSCNGIWNEVEEPSHIESVISKMRKSTLKIRLSYVDPDFKPMSG